VACFIRGLDVQIDEIAALQCFQRRIHFSLIVGVYVARGPRNIDHLQAGVPAYSFQQIHSGDHGSGEAVLLSKGRHGRSRPLSPQPYGIGGALSCSYAPPVDLMPLQNRPGRLHQRHEQLAVLSPGQVLFHRLATDVVGRSALGSGAGLEHQKIAIAHTGVEPLPGHERGQGFDQLLPLLGGDMPGAVVLHQPIINGHKVAAKSDIIRAQVHIHGRCLQRRPAGIAFRRIVAQDRKVGHIASRGKALRHRPGQAASALPGQSVHIGLFCRLQRRPAT